LQPPRGRAREGREEKGKGRHTLTHRHEIIFWERFWEGFRTKKAKWQSQRNKPNPTQQSTTQVDPTMHKHTKKQNKQKSKHPDRPAPHQWPVGVAVNIQNYLV